MVCITWNYLALKFFIKFFLSTTPRRWRSWKWREVEFFFGILFSTLKVHHIWWAKQHLQIFYLTAPLIGDMATTCTGSPFALVMHIFSLINQAICGHTNTRSIVINSRGVWDCTQPLVELSLKCLGFNPRHCLYLVCQGIEQPLHLSSSGVMYHCSIPSTQRCWDLLKL